MIGDFGPQFYISLNIRSSYEKDYDVDVNHPECVSV